MIVVRTPLRISLFGGGSDLPAFYERAGRTGLEGNGFPTFYERAGGAVLSFTIDKYIHIAVQPVASKHIKVMYSEVEQVSHISQLKHKLVKTCLHVFGPSLNVEIASFADIPTKGTGLGSSSTFVVGLIQALTALKGIDLPKRELAEIGFEAENLADQEIWTDNLQKSIGKQDHYAAAFGGFNLFEFLNNGTVKVQPVQMPFELSQNLFLVYTGKTRSADRLLSIQTKLITESQIVFDKTIKLVDQVYQAQQFLTERKYDEIGYLLDEAWRVKRSIAHHISDPDIDLLYTKILQAGALGGKLLGAGAGGYILAYVPFDKHKQFLSNFSEEQLLPFRYTSNCSERKL